MSADSEQWLNQAPKVVDALKRGSLVSITSWGGRVFSGTVCDREQTGLLLDVRERGASADGYVFLPWSSVEQVVIREISPRRVQVLAELAAVEAVSRSVFGEGPLAAVGGV